MGLRIMIVGANPFLSSAYGNICRYLASTLALKNQVIVYGEGWQGNLCRMNNFTILPSQINSFGKQSQPGALRVMQAIFRYAPQLVITIGDLVVLDYFSRFRKRPYWVAHFPVDSEPFRNMEVEIMSRADCRIVPSKYGVNVLKNCHKEKSYYLPHPVGQDFGPLEQRTARKTFPFVKKKDFIFGFVGINTKRKQIPRLMEAFANEFRGKKNVKLWLNTTRQDTGGWDLVYLADYFKIQKQIIWTPYLDYFCLTPTELNLVYNSFDVHCLPTSGEGFGMPIAETMTCGIPNIVTDYSAAPEVMGKGGISVPYCHKYIDAFASWKALIDIPKLQSAMKTIYLNPKLREELGEKAKDKAKEYEYTKVMADWLTFFDLLENSKEYRQFNKWRVRTAKPRNIIKKGWLKDTKPKRYLKGT